MKVLGADPFVLFDDKSKSYYCYCTNEDGKPFNIYKSNDLINWKFVSYALDTSINCWFSDWLWAPECYFNPHNGYYYLFYSARLKKELVAEYFQNAGFTECAKIGVAVSKSPEGPFINITNRPLDYYPFDYSYHDINEVASNVFADNLTYEDSLKAKTGVFVPSIDVSLTFDGDDIYLYYSRCCYKNCVYDKSLHKYIEESHVLGAKLDNKWWTSSAFPTMPTVSEEFIGYDKGKRKDKYVQLIAYGLEPQKWENGHVFDYENSNGLLPNRRWTEGSSTVKLNLQGKVVYCLTYSCNSYTNSQYGVGIAFSEQPLGQYAKYQNNPIIHELPTESLYSTGHGCWIKKDNDYYYFFHGRNSKDSPRSLYIGKLNVISKDNVYVDGIKSCNLMSLNEKGSAFDFKKSLVNQK